MPVRTLQKAQARVHVSPMIMNVACRLLQHSPMLGQPASSHTVVRPWPRTMRAVSAWAADPGARTRIHAGLAGRARGAAGSAAADDAAGVAGALKSVSSGLRIAAIVERRGAGANRAAWRRASAR